MDADNDALLRVKGTASVPNLASAISHAVYDNKTVTLRAIGASAVSQAVKAVAVARGYVAPRGIDLSIVPGFATVTMPDGDVTALTLKIIVS
jgi:stage V sporulation protein S